MFNHKASLLINHLKMNYKKKYAENCKRLKNKKYEVSKKI